MMEPFARTEKTNGHRRRILDLAPLELDCMNTLWAIQEGTVRQIRDALAATRPRAYTTIMTIMDRLAHKGVVTRHKIGRAYLYRPNVSAEQARARAVAQLVEHFFAGSAEALLAQLSETPPPPVALPRERARPALPAPVVPKERGRRADSESAEEFEYRPAPKLDDTLL